MNEDLFLAVDPGPYKFAYVVWDRKQDRMVHFNQGPNKDIIRELGELWLIHRWSETVIEGVYYYGRILGKDTFRTLECIGRLSQKAEDFWHSEGEEQSVYQIYYPDVALHFCGMRNKVTQGNINAVLMERYGDKGCKKDPGMLHGIYDHIWSAVHVAAYWMDCREEEVVKQIIMGEELASGKKPRKTA